VLGELVLGDLGVGRLVGGQLVVGRVVGFIVLGELSLGELSLGDLSAGELPLYHIFKRTILFPMPYCADVLTRDSRIGSRGPFLTSHLAPRGKLHPQG
jgi:hypothetical protein